MKFKTRIFLMIAIMATYLQAYAQRPFFDKSKDILIAQFDSKPDPDDIHAQAALGSMLVHNDLNGVNYYAVAGAIGIQNGAFIDSDTLFDMAFGSNNWTDANANWSASVTNIKNKVIPILQNGGKVWVQEAGQSNITADWIAQVLQTVPAATVKANVVVVQHSKWNEDQTTASDLNYVKDKTWYFAIDDGNAPDGAAWGDRGPWGTPEYRSRNTTWIAQAKSSPNAKAKQLWTEADRVIQEHGHRPSHSYITNGGVDYSDCAENWWIFNIGTNADSTAKFWSRYVTNTTGSPTPTADCNAAPTGLSVSSSTNTSITVNYNNTTNDTRTFELRAFPQGTFNGNINGATSFAAGAASSTSITISGLTAGTGYDLILRALCVGETPGASPVAPTVVGSTSGGTSNGCNGVDYEETNGLVVIEAENLNNVNNTSWNAKTAVAGFTGAGYLSWDGADSFSTPGNGVISATIKINDPGEYRFQWRSKVGKGTNPTEHNDSWLKFPDASNFFARKGASTIFPSGSGQTPNPAGAGAAGWFKVYLSNTTDWTWVSSTSDNDAHEIFVQFDTPGNYTIQISGRSKDHLIDRIVLYKNGAANPTATTNTETSCTGGNTVAVTGVSVSPTTVSINEGQTNNLTATVAPASATNKNITWSSSNTAIATVDSSGVVTGVAAGTATITVTTADGGFTATASITINSAPSGNNIILGNSATTGGTNDGWNSNLVINETDIYTNNTGASQQLQIDQFVFYARQKGDPVTPFVVKVNADNNFTVLAVGTTRTSSSYNVGENELAFNTGTAKTITVANGETIATGFLDANANGSGGSVGSVIPFSTNAPADQIWYTGGADFGNSGSITEGNAPVAGLNTILTLSRSYHYRITLSPTTGTPVTADCSAAPANLAVSGSTDTSVTLSFDNTATDTRTFELRAFSDGGFNGDINTGGVGFAAAGAGSTSVTMTNLQAGTTYDFVLRALCGAGGNGPSPLATISGTTSGTTTTTPQTVTLSAVEDAYVQGTAGINNNVLRVEQGNRTSYVKFDVSSVTGTITNATLKLTVDEDSGNGTIEVSTGASNWTENGINSSNAPAKGTSLGSLNKTFAKQTEQEFTLTGVTRDGNFLTFVITHTGSNDVSFKSSEASSGTPELTLTFNSNRSAKISGDTNLIVAYPNPAANEIFLKGISENDRISIMDVSGRSIMRKSVSNQKSMRLDISNLENGIYFVTVRNKLKENTIRFIKQ